MESRNRYTKEENLIILSKVSANPSNLSQAFRECAQELNRSVGSVSTEQELMKNQRTERLSAYDP